MSVTFTIAAVASAMAGRPVYIADGHHRYETACNYRDELVAERGSLVGALVSEPDDSIFAIASNGVVIRTPVADIRQTGRQTMGVNLMGLADGVTVVAVARSAAEEEDEEILSDDGDSDPDPVADEVAGDHGESTSDEKE